MNPVRSSLIVLEAPAFHRENCPDGVCHWCGYPLVLYDVATWHNRQRVRHKADGLELRRQGEESRDCDREFRQSMVWNGRNALRWQAWKERWLDHKGKNANIYAIICVDCEDICEIGYVWVPKKRVGFATRKRTTLKKWEADHEIEIVDGGLNTIENLRSRCCECHTEKTVRERRRRQADMAFTEAISTIDLSG